MEYCIETHQLVKRYKEKVVVDHVDMHVKKGEIYGFVGPNGAGKSTIMKMLLQLVRPDAGDIVLFGQFLRDHDVECLKRIGSIIEYPYFYENLSAKQNLELHCDYMGYPNKGQIDKVLQQVHLQQEADKRVTHFSLGMRQRLAIARAILTKPELLLLDEPINALDPEGIKEIRELLRQIHKDHGTTIVISSHLLSEVEQLADTIGILQEGKLKKEIAMAEVHTYQTEYIELLVDAVDLAAYVLEKECGVQDFRVISHERIEIYDLHMEGKEISKLLVQHGIGLHGITRKQTTLEDYFFQITNTKEKDA